MVGGNIYRINTSVSQSLAGRNRKDVYFNVHKAWTENVTDEEWIRQEGSASELSEYE
jgi:hypothetical protein